MNFDQAKKLADHLTRDFRGFGPPSTVWVGVLAPLDFDRSFVAYLALLGQVSEKPSVAEFLAAYEITAPPTNPAPKVSCQKCDGEGWTPTEFQAHGRTYPGVTPCDCPAGRRKDTVYAAVVRHNHAQPWHIDPKHTATVPARRDEEF